MQTDRTESAQRRIAAVPARLAALRSRIDAAATASGRDIDEVRLLLAVKTMPVEVVRAAVAAGTCLVGENRVSELVDHAPALVDLGPELHVIGHVQSNKVGAAVAWAHCIETVDSVPLAQRISRRCETVDRELDVMIQVNVSAESTKFGVSPDEAATLATTVAALPRLRLVGLMTIGANTPDVAVVRAGYARLRELRDAVVARVPTATELSMGMSGDLEHAIAEGATIVRVGRAAFGDRAPRPA